MFFLEKAIGGINQGHHAGCGLARSGILKAIGMILAGQFFIGLLNFFPGGSGLNFQRLIGVISLIIVIFLLALASRALGVILAILALILAFKGLSVVIVTGLVTEPGLEFLSQLAIRLFQMREFGPGQIDQPFEDIAHGNRLAPFVLSSQYMRNPGSWTG